MSLPHQQDLKLNTLLKYVYLQFVPMIGMLIGIYLLYCLPHTDNPTQNDWDNLHIAYIITFGSVGGWFILFFFWGRAINKRDRLELKNRDDTSKLPITFGE